MTNVEAAPAFDTHPASGSRPGWREAGSGRALLLLHGWSLSGEAFDGQRALASHGYRVIAPDHAGHGLSAALPHAGQASLAQLAADAAGLIGHLGLRDVVVVGWSMGAMVAWELMRGDPAPPLAAIGAIDMTPRLVSAADWPHGLHGRYDTVQAAQMAAHVRQDWPRLIDSVRAGLWSAGSKPDAAQAGHIAAIMRQCAPDALAALWQDMARQDYRPALRQARLPLFHLVGERSRLYAPAVGQATLALQPAARLATIDGTGHAPHMERPAAFNTALLEMLAWLDATGAQASSR
ncbi:alpha/beta fold hydrolase [Cupriavidus sp. D39]|uniref:alpha/beta fold hydrolase n=1 Tax=Cupriavidus sp. D39 TaxID=2997877 RepID=UPI002270322A|nr:alpha/beta hydrolase [Cupriavidus sp. D39]MCY0855589.1 alpha/beta hydrolase [Cupriavidus sp. D39]